MRAATPGTRSRPSASSTSASTAPPTQIDPVRPTPSKLLAVPTHGPFSPPMTALES